MYTETTPVFEEINKHEKITLLSDSIIFSIRSHQFYVLNLLAYLIDGCGGMRYFILTLAFLIRELLESAGYSHSFRDSGDIFP
jgi:hypothetical protein